MIRMQVVCCMYEIRSLSNNERDMVRTDRRQNCCAEDIADPPGKCLFFACMMMMIMSETAAAASCVENKTMGQGP